MNWTWAWDNAENNFMICSALVGCGVEPILASYNMMHNMMRRVASFREGYQSHGGSVAVRPRKGWSFERQNKEPRAMPPSNVPQICEPLRFSLVDSAHVENPGSRNPCVGSPRLSRTAINLWVLWHPSFRNTYFLAENNLSIAKHNHGRFKLERVLGPTSPADFVESTWLEKDAHSPPFPFSGKIM